MKRRISAGIWDLGYTMIEVMIVLAVTGGLFISTVLALSGKQAQNEVGQTARNFESRIQTVVSDVASGYYPTGFSCVPGNPNPIVTSGAVTPGTNTGCVFLGKIVNLKSTSANIITVVGRQYKYVAASPNARVDVMSLVESNPAVVANASVNVTEAYEYQYGLTIQKAVAINGGAGYKAIGFMTELGGGSSGVEAGTGGGSRSIILYGIPGNAALNSTLDRDILQTPLVPLPDGIRLCFLSGNGQLVEITIGADKNQTNTNVLIDKGVGSDCN